MLLDIEPLLLLLLGMSGKFSGRRKNPCAFMPGHVRIIENGVLGSNCYLPIVRNSKHERTGQRVLPKVFQDNGIEDVNRAIASLIVHSEKIVVPLQTQKSKRR